MGKKKDCDEEHEIDCVEDTMPDKLTALRDAIDEKAVKGKGEIELTPKVLESFRAMVEKLEDAAAQIEFGHRGPWSQFLEIGSPCTFGSPCDTGLKFLTPSAAITLHSGESGL